MNSSPCFIFVGWGYKSIITVLSSNAAMRHTCCTAHSVVETLRFGLLTMIDELPGLWQSPLLLQNRWQNNRGRNAKPNRALVMQARQSVPVPFVLRPCPFLGLFNPILLIFVFGESRPKFGAVFEMDGVVMVPLTYPNYLRPSKCRRSQRKTWRRHQPQCA